MTDLTLFAPPDFVMAASRWPDNAALVRDCAQIGYLREEWLTLDPTFGQGNWWVRWRPLELVTHDIRQDGVDFRALPEADATFDAAVYDPPYIAPGGRDKSTVGDFNDRYGLHETPQRPAELQVYINDGLAEVGRVVRPGGFILVKCCDYVNGGKVWWGTHHTTCAGLDAGLELVDRLEHIRHPGPQSQTTQEHARRNLSTLLVFKKGKP